MIHLEKQPRKTRLFAVSALSLVIPGFALHYILIRQSPVVTQIPASLASPTTASLIAEPSPKKIGVPLRLKIPSIAVDAMIEKVTVAADGSMGVPKDILNVGWYGPGTRPGDIGSAVIDGHVNWFHGATAVFVDLHKVKVGDSMTVEDSEGAVVSFVIRNIKTLDAAADSTNVFTSSDGKAHLNLVTCSGAWDKRSQQYVTRLVIFADKQ